MNVARRWMAMGLAALVFASMLAVPPARAQGALNGLETDVDQIAHASRPSVVIVLAQRTVTQRRRHGAPVTRALHTRVGSGVAVDDNLVLTTASVTLAAERVLVQTVSGEQIEGHLVGSDLVFNLALIRLDGVKLKPLRFATRMAQPGDWVMVLGTSYGREPTQSVGNVSAISPDPRQPLLQLTNDVYPGNSGGTALNARGELIGLVQGELGTPA